MCSFDSARDAPDPQIRNPGTGIFDHSRAWESRTLPVCTITCDSHLQLIGPVGGP